MASKPTRAEMKSKTAEERKWLENYFYFEGGCLKKPIPEAEYIKAVRAKAQSLNLKQKALSKIGLDESQVNEIKPVTFEGFNFDSKAAHTANGTSSRYEVTWLFFSATQVYVYIHVFDMTSNDTKVRTEEYFYKDVTNFSSSNDSRETSILKSKGCPLKPKFESIRGQVDTASFCIIVPGDKLTVAMTPTDETERAIQGMKQKLREKKG